ncbi:MAG: YcxB family protein [Lachnospiraceae bacterium]
MSVEFDIKLAPKDMFRFNMYHTYTSFQGIFSLGLGVIVILLAAITVGEVDLGYSILYFMFGILFLVYNPLSLYASSKRKIQKSEVLRNSLHYTFNEKGIIVNVNEAKAELIWNQIYKIVTTRHNLLIYSTRRNAYIIPLESLGGLYEPATDIMKNQVESYRLKLRKIK